MLRLLAKLRQSLTGPLLTRGVLTGEHPLAVARNSVNGGLLAALLLVCSIPVLGQGTAGSIQGTITDDSGAIIPDAILSARDLDTGRSFTSRSNNAGLFLFGQLPPGGYELTAEKTGFGSAVRQNVTVRVNDQLHVDFALKVGAVKREYQRFARKCRC